MFSNIFLSLEPEIPGRCQTGRCIWAPHRSQDLCVPWSLASPRLHARMQVRKKTEKWNVQPTQKNESSSSSGGGRDATAMGVSDAVPVCSPIKSLPDLKQTWNTLGSLEMEHLWGLGLLKGNWLGGVLTTPVPVCSPINSLPELKHTLLTWDGTLWSPEMKHLELLRGNDVAVRAVDCWLLQCRCVDHGFPPPYSSLCSVLYITLLHCNTLHTFFSALTINSQLLL